MYNRLFWSKYLFRVMHITTLTILSSNIIWEYLFQTQNEVPQLYIQWILAIIMIVSGFINTSLLDPKNKMKTHSNQWVGMMHFKLLSSIILMTPILSYFLEKEFILEIRFGLVIFWLLVSPFLRFYREFWTEFHRIKPQQLQMVQFEQIPE